MPDFSAIVGRNLKTGIGGHRVLMKLAIADYLYKTYHLVRFGGRIWRYDWGKGYYTYDPGDVLLHQEVVSIMTEVGDNEYFTTTIVSLTNSTSSTWRVIISRIFKTHSTNIQTLSMLKMCFQTRLYK